ncbi:MAG: aminotransferase class V-fold PLP-dependent enzyme [Planctomycetes bacterium]|nr:aminotransferase class V-fold PLP-dependent enzyme [Planctomycetota bacterium]
MLNAADRVRLFPVLGRMTYLNTAWRGPISTPAAEAAKGYIDDLALRGVTGFDDWQKVWYATRDEFAAFVNAQPAEIQLLPNATEAFARIALGIDWRAGDHAVVPARDYPGVARVLNDLVRHGVELANVPTRADGSVPAEDLIAAINPRTRLVAASHVDFRTGYRIDAAKLAEGCRARGALCALDSVQGIGAVPVDVKQWGVDCATFEGRKWLNGLDTLGVLYVRESSLDALTPHTLGTYSVPSPYDFETPNQPLAPGAQRFQLGAPAMPQVYAMGAALKLQKDLGPARIQARVAELAAELREMAAGQGYSVIGNDWPTENRSGIVSLRREGKLADAGLGAKLVAGKVAASARQGILRVSPHFYNESADLKRLFEVLAGS